MLMAMVNIYMLMVIFIEDYSKIINAMTMVNINIIMAKLTEVFGKIIFRKEKALKKTLMGLNMKECF